MPAQLTYPGVYVQEIPSGVHTITGVATSITAFVGRALRGPVGKQTLITSYADYERRFGGLWQESPMSFAVQDFFLNGGSQAIIVRVYNSTIPPAPDVPIASDPVVQAVLAAAANASIGSATPLSVARAARAALSSPALTYALSAVQAGEARANEGATPQAVLKAISEAVSSNPTVTAIKEAVKRTVQEATVGNPVTGVKVAEAGHTASKAAAPPFVVDAEAVAKVGEDAAAHGAAPDAVVNAINEAAGDQVLNAAEVAVAQGTPAGIMLAVTSAAGLKPTGPVTSVLESGKKALEAGKSVAEINNAMVEAAAQSLGQPTEPTAGQPAVPAVGGQPAVPAVGGQPAAPAVGGQPAVPAVGGQPAVPAAGGQPAVPAAGGQPAVPAAGGQPAPSPSTTTKAMLTIGALKLEAASEGKWGANLRARVELLATMPGLTTDQRNAIANDLGVAITDVFTLTVHENGGTTEQFSNLTVKTSPRQIDKILAASSLVRVVNHTLSVPPTTLGTMPKGDPWPPDGSSIKPDPAAQGSDGSSVNQTDIIGNSLKGTGIAALDEADLFNILVIPGPIAGDDKDYQAVVGIAVPMCVKRRAIMIVDPPLAWTAIDRVIDPSAPNQSPLAGTASDHAAVFFPRILKPNPLHKNLIEPFSPSGAMAGIFARTDTQRGVWKAPAGLQATISGISGLELQMNDTENGELNTRGVNCLRVKPAVGSVVWGARTRAGDDRIASEWRYIPVRRTALFLEESLFRGTQWVVFEPNDEALWTQIRLNVGAFMHSLFRQGAFQGLTPKEAYLVKCDHETTTQNDVDNGIVNIVVGFAPLKPAEFVVLQIQQLAGQIQT
jgi:phage tail sheath protein FI